MRYCKILCNTACCPTNHRQQAFDSSIHRIDSMPGLKTVCRWRKQQHMKMWCNPWLGEALHTSCKECEISGQTKHIYTCMYQSRSVMRVEPIVALIEASARKQECCARRYQTLSSEHLPQSASYYPDWVCHTIQVTANKPLRSPDKIADQGSLSLDVSNPKPWWLNVASLFSSARADRSCETPDPQLHATLLWWNKTFLALSRINS